MYKQIKLDLNESQIDKIIKNKPIKIANGQIGTGSTYVSLHPSNCKIIEKSYKNGKGCVINISHHELKRTCEKNEDNGSGFWSNIWSKLKKVYKFGKDSGIFSKLADAAVVPLSSMTASPELVLPARLALKQLTGIGMKKKKKITGSGLYLS